MAASRDLLWIGGGRLLTALATLAGIRLATALLPAGQYGLLSLLVSFQVFCGLFLVNPVGQHINRQTHAWLDEGSLRSRLAGYHRYILVVAVIGGGITAGWAWAQEQSPARAGLHALAVGLMVIAATWNGTSIPLLNMLGLRAASVVWGVATVLAGLLCSLALTWLYPVALSWFAGQMLGMSLGALGAGRLLRRRLPPGKDGHWPLVDAVSLRRYCLPLALATGCMWVQLSGYRLVLEHYWGLAALGLAMAGTLLAGQLWGLLESLVIQFLIPLFYRRISGARPDEGAAAFSDLLDTLGPVYLVVAAATLWSASALLPLLVDARYAGAVYFLMLGALVECCRVLGNVLANAAQVTQRMGALIAPYAAGATVVCAGLVMLGRHGADVREAMTVLVAGAATMLAVMFWRMRAELAFRLHGWRWLLALALLLGSGPALLNPAPAPTLSAALVRVALVAIATAPVLALLLWNNPAAARLLSVRLGPGGQ